MGASVLCGSPMECIKAFYEVFKVKRLRNIVLSIVLSTIFVAEFLFMQ